MTKLLQLIIDTPFSNLKHYLRDLRDSYRRFYLQASQRRLDCHGLKFHYCRRQLSLGALDHNFRLRPTRFLPQNVSFVDILKSLGSIHIISFGTQWKYIRDIHAVDVYLNSIKLDRTNGPSAFFTVVSWLVNLPPPNVPPPEIRA